MIDATLKKSFYPFLPFSNVFEPSIEETFSNSDTNTMTSLDLVVFHNLL